MHNRGGSRADCSIGIDHSWCACEDFDLRKNKTISIQPIRILWVEVHEFVEKDVGHRCHPHGGAGMPWIGLTSGIDLDDELRLALDSRRNKNQSGDVERKGIVLRIANGRALSNGCGVVTYSQKPDRVDGKLIILIIRHDFGSKDDFNELLSWRSRWGSL